MNVRFSQHVPQRDEAMSSGEIFSNHLHKAPTVLQNYEKILIQCDFLAIAYSLCWALVSFCSFPFR